VAKIKELLIASGSEPLWKIGPLQRLAACARFDVLPSRSEDTAMTKAPKPPSAGVLRGSQSFDLEAALLTAFDTNNRINQYLIDNLPAEAWDAKPPDGKGRTIKAIVAHMHNVRVMWLKATKAEEIPEQLDRTRVTPGQAMRALENSRRALSAVISQAFHEKGRIRGFRPDVAGFLGYLIAHDAHHRGQVATLARQLGHPLPQKVMFGMWEWNSR
jgi:uncharacterized damage-inducible protein DinB